MNNLIVTTIATVLLAFGCASSSPPPTQQLADVQAANRSATELGAQKVPKAQLHLKLAEEQMKQAQTAMEHDNNKIADGLLMRAKADAELAIAVTRADHARTEASKAIDRSNAQRSLNSEQGAPQ